jgi:hypothetical protein
MALFVGPFAVVVDVEDDLIVDEVDGELSMLQVVFSILLYA